MAAIPSVPAEKKMHVHFQDIEAVELIRYISRVCDVSFAYDPSELDFLLSLNSTQALSKEGLLKTFLLALNKKGYDAKLDHDCYVIGKLEPPKEEKKVIEEVFAIHKLKYHKGDEIEASVKKLVEQHHDPALHKASLTLQWIKSTNSLVFSAESHVRDVLLDLIRNLDVPLRQVFIEVLVVETDIKHALDFGLDWGASGNLGSNVQMGFGNSQPGSRLYTSLEKKNPLSAFNLGGGFDLGIIGDILLHKGRTHLSLASLVSALESDHSSQIVLNQKIITQDNKNSTLFVGDNIPFTGSIVQTNGQSQQTTANIEYRDVGVKLSITPMLGEDEMITLDINQEITESLDPYQGASSHHVGGIRTTKTNMVTHVHVPNKHFLVLSGMIRNAKAQVRNQVPCLGGLPAISAAFSHDLKRNEKRNILIFVRPQIIASAEEGDQVTAPLEKLFEKPQ